MDSDELSQTENTMAAVWDVGGGPAVKVEIQFSSPSLEAAVRRDDMNSLCADCGAPNPEWANVSVGVVLCIQCAGVHRSLPPAVAKVKSLTLDKWAYDEIESLRVVGNTLAKALYDSRLSYTHKRVSFRTPLGLRRYVIKEKYSAGPAVQDLLHPAAHDAAVAQAGVSKCHLAGRPRQREGWLMKKGKDNDKWAARWFELDFPSLTYWAVDKKADGKPDDLGAPKETLRLTDTIITLRSERAFHTKFGLQLTYRQGDDEGDPYEFRNFFVSAESGEELTAWLNDIRTNKALLLGLSPDMIGTTQGEAILAELSREVVKEGWLQKTGPKGTGWKKRWVTLHDNRLLYAASEFSAVYKGNIVINSQCKVEAVPERVPHNHCFIVCTSQIGGRSYLFKADTESGAHEWVAALRAVVSTHEDVPAMPADAAGGDACGESARVAEAEAAAGAAASS